MSEIKPLVTVWCPAYNQEKYIAQTIEGFISQKVNFPIEIIIHDDASKDKTADIIRSYQAKHPELILPIYQTENQFSKDGAHLTKTCFRVARGKYIAPCEGDDYWTDPLKLQKQVDFLEKNPDFSSCFHSVKILKNGKLEEDDMTDVNSVTTILDLASNNYIRTCSYIFRNQVSQENLKAFEHIHGADYFLCLLVAKYGKIKKLPDVMAVYRRHNESIWSSKTSVSRFKTMVDNVEAMFPYFKDDVVQVLKQQHADILLKFATFLVDNNLVDEEKDYLFGRMEINKNSVLNKMVGLVYDNKYLKSRENSIKFTFTNALRLLKNRLGKSSGK
jgi:glycosyltransferase involved in cell wall biosynthesis